MKRIAIGVVLGLLIATVAIAILGPIYAAAQKKIGLRHGYKQGQIAVINFLAEHFPEPDGSPVKPGHHLGLKWYTVNVIETNGIKTLQVRNKM